MPPQLPAPAALGHIPTPRPAICMIRSLTDLTKTQVDFNTLTDATRCYVLTEVGRLGLWVGSPERMLFHCYYESELELAVALALVRAAAPWVQVVG